MSTLNIYIPLDFNGISKKPKYFGGFTMLQILTYIGALSLGYDAFIHLKNIILSDYSFSTFLKNFWFDDLIFFGEVSFLIAIKPLLTNSPTAWHKSFIYFDGNILMINRTGFNRYEVDFNDVIHFEDRDPKSVRSYLTFTHKNGSKTSIPWLLSNEITKEDEQTIKGLFIAIQKRIDQNLSSKTEENNLFNSVKIP